MKLAVVPALLFSLLAVPAFAGLFDNAADEYQEAVKEQACCANAVSLKGVDTSYCYSPGRITDKCLSSRRGVQFLQECGDYLSVTEQKQAECIKEGFSQKQCDAANEAGKLQASRECPQSPD